MKRLERFSFPHGPCALRAAALVLFALAPRAAALDSLDPLDGPFSEDQPGLAAPPLVSASDLLVNGYPLLSPEEGPLGLEWTVHVVAFTRSHPLSPSAAAGESLRFLASQQRPDGSWGHDDTYSVAATSWVLLALLYNETTSVAHDDWRDMYERAVRFLLDARREDGSFADADLLPDGGGDRNAPVHALLAAAATTRDPRIARAAETAARAAFGTNAPPDLFRQLDLLAEHPSIGGAFFAIQKELARSLRPARDPSDGLSMGFWNAAPEYGELRDLLPELPDVSLPRWLKNDVQALFHGPPVDIVVLATAASLLVPGRMGVTRRIPCPDDELLAEPAPATERIDARPLDSRETRTCAWRWLFAQQAPDGSWPGADPVVDTSLALLALASEPSRDNYDRAGGFGIGESSDAVAAAVGYLASAIRDDGSFPVRDPEGDAAALPVLALRAISETSPHPEVRALLRKAGAEPYDWDIEYTFGERLALAWPALPRADWEAFCEADRRARRWGARPEHPFEPDKVPKLLLHWDEPPTAPFLAEDSPLPAAAFRPLPADATPEARAIRATCRWLLVPPGRSIRPLPSHSAATNAPAARFTDDVKVTVRRHAEGAEEKSHAESAENAEEKPHAESAENAEPVSRRRDSASPPANRCDRMFP